MTQPIDFGSSCEAVRALLERYHDDELPQSLAAPLRGHLLDCGDCRGRLGELQNQRGWMAPSEAFAAPAGFAQNVARLAFSGAGAAADEPEFDESSLEGEPAPVFDLMPFVLGVASVAAAGLLALSIALGLSAHRTGGAELLAEPLPEVLRELETLNGAAPEEADEATTEQRIQPR